MSIKKLIRIDRKTEKLFMSITSEKNSRPIFRLRGYRKINAKISEGWRPYVNFKQSTYQKQKTYPE